ncbi:Co2+/Mg2+ efflux protein ApaG [Chryseobacterium sp. MP_3.2]|uniref:Co2+/Mg2+ efflux protein ApaG n=1 Tax=Chryseobacterium sp. MP_3.2 TaxID=3071712 RepID=UPI002E0B30E1|nr:ApaG protein [Chryseobacterium sp. MP_3.2]
MFSTTTFDIKVTVTPEYDVKNSFPSDNRHVFRYNITIENLGEFSIKLLRRKWLIYDVGFGFTEVSGDGVIGLTPEIHPGETFKYFSNVVLRSGVGNMTGTYYCSQLLTNTNMEIEIPKFNLVSEVLSN